MSSNQAGGLSTLCFLQEVDQLIGQDHLFKRSIILMKAWCYYESRILGSHHGLLSTYALTILIMYIFNVCYDDIDSPLRALYYVLQYFCQFDWDNYAISIHGPVSLQSLPVIQGMCVCVCFFRQPSFITVFSWPLLFDKRREFNTRDVIYNVVVICVLVSLCVCTCMHMISLYVS